MASTSINISDNLNSYLSRPERQQQVGGGGHSATSFDGFISTSSSSGPSGSSSGTSSGLFKSVITRVTGGVSTEKVGGYFYTPLASDETGPNGPNRGPGGSSKPGSWIPWTQSNAVTDPSDMPRWLAWCPTLSLTRGQRYIGFLACIFAGSICFLLAGLCLPVLIFQARKFAIFFTMGSAFLMSSFSLLWGPWEHVKHITSRDRIPFTAAYFASLIATLYCALSIQSTILTTIFAIVQIIALIWYVLSYLPGGTAGLKFVTSMVASSASRVLPV